MSSLLQPLFEHMAWADHRVVTLLAGIPRVTPVPNVMRLLAHVVGAERVWLSRIRGENRNDPIWPEWTLEQVRSTAEENAAAFLEIVAGLSDADAARTIEYRNSQGVSFRTPLADILTHVALHGSYHRGQIAAALRAGGVTPVSTDYIVYVRERESRG
jgi:uncharacterized damage-inducible protein DinB